MTVLVLRLQQCVVEGIEGSLSLVPRRIGRPEGIPATAGVFLRLLPEFPLLAPVVAGPTPALLTILQRPLAANNLRLRGNRWTDSL